MGYLISALERVEKDVLSLRSLAENFFYLIKCNNWGENGGSIGEFTLTTSKGYVETVAPSFANAPSKKTF